MQNGGTATRANWAYVATGIDQSGVMVTNRGTLTLLRSRIRTSGNTRSMDESSVYGLNAGVLVTSRSHRAMTKNSVTTSGAGSNGAFLTGSGTWINLSGDVIKATGAGGHGVDATGGATMVLPVRPSTSPTPKP
jgi:hypothetical protein